MPRHILLDVDLHIADDITPQEEQAARALALDSDQLGVDAYICETTDGAPFSEVVAHLLMFAPGWLFGRRWVVGWTAERSMEEED